MTMLEKAAMAAWEEGRHHDLTWEPSHTEAWGEIARAVLMAVREPGMTVCRSSVPGFECVNAKSPDFGKWVGDDIDGGTFIPGDVFTAMIDAILNEVAQ